jgi:hypothetical protein
MTNDESKIGRELASLVPAARRHHQHAATSEDRAQLRAAHLRLLGGGSTHSVYALAVDGVACCLKFSAVDAARRAGREWLALQSLTAHGFRAHPRPFHYSPDPLLPAVVMARLPGRHLRLRRLTAAQLRALRALLVPLWQITPQTTARTFAPIYKDARHWLTVVQSAAQTLRPVPGDALTGEAYRLLHTWLYGPDSARLLVPAPAVFSNGDLNPSNLLWDGQALRLLDYEFSGWSDRAFDLADLVEHNQSRRTPDAVWLAFVADCDLSPEEQARFRRVRRLLAFTWLIGEWPTPDAPPDPAFLDQLARVRGLLAG